MPTKFENESERRRLLSEASHLTEALKPKAPAGSKEIKIEWIEITPRTAKNWMAANTHNRNLREATVAAYARDMKSGNWLSTHQGIAFASDGTLLDGQHRLAAIIESGVTVRMLVTSGLPAKAEGKLLTTQDAMDRGAGRSLADQLKLNHDFKQNPNLAIAAFNVIGHICTGRRPAKGTVALALQCVQIIGPSVFWAMGLVEQVKTFRIGPVLGASAFVHAANPVLADEFLKRLVVGNNLTERNPVLHLRNFLIGGGHKQEWAAAERAKAHETILHTIHLFAEKRQVQELTWAKGGLEYFSRKQPKLVERIKAVFA